MPAQPADKPDDNGCDHDNKGIGVKS